nr:PREDICTED: uncharacterized protein LOC105662083 isoform X2 [Megachile rotundata]
MALLTSIWYCWICSGEHSILLSKPLVVWELSSPVNGIKWARLSRRTKRFSSTQTTAGGAGKGISVRVIPLQGFLAQIRSPATTFTLSIQLNSSTCPPDFTVRGGSFTCPLESPVRSGLIGSSPNNAGRGDAGIAHSPESPVWCDGGTIHSMGSLFIRGDLDCASDTQGLQ